MQIRSGKDYSIVPDPQSMVHNHTSKHQRSAQTTRATRASKRARSASDTPALALESEPDPNEVFLLKRSKRRKATNSHAKQASASIIDLTGDDDPGPGASGGLHGARTGTSDVRQSPSSSFMDLARHYDLSPETSIGAFRPTTRHMPVEHEVQWKRGGKGRKRSDLNMQIPQSSPPALTTDDLEGTGRWFADDQPHHGPSSQLPDRTINKPRSIVAASQVMFTVEEAKRYLTHAAQDGVSRSHPPYTLQTGEYVPYPVTKTYHLGAMGRYGVFLLQAAPSQWVLDLTPTLAKPKNTSPNLSGYAATMIREERAPLSKTARKPSTPEKKNIPKMKSSQHNSYREPAEYVFDWGTYYGKRFSEVPRVYIESVLGSPRLDELMEDRRGLREALQLYAPHHPRLTMALRPTQVSSLPSHAPAHARREHICSDSSHLAKLHFPSGTVGQASAPVIDRCADKQSRPLEAEPYTPSSSPGHGKTLGQVPRFYSRFMGDRKDAIVAQEKQGEALAEDYRFDFGKYKNKRLYEASDAYLATLESSNIVGQNKMLQRALFARNDKMGRSNDVLIATMKRWARMNSVR
jgi:hypothetical protein